VLRIEGAVAVAEAESRVLSAFEPPVARSA